jgi:hypothetical protein
VYREPVITKKIESPVIKAIPKDVPKAKVFKPKMTTSKYVSVPVVEPPKPKIPEPVVFVQEPKEAEFDFDPRPPTPKE